MEAAKQYAHSDEREKFLIRTLSQLSVEELQEFNNCFYRMMARAYRADLWEAVWILECGCSDDSFEDFREWLIGQGQAVFEKTLSDPDNLADFVSKEMAGAIYECNMSSILDEAYAAITNSDAPIDFLGYPEAFSLIGEIADYLRVGNLMDDIEDYPGYEKFPRITAKFGKCDERKFPFDY
jgi:hypothetical protein